MDLRILITLKIRIDLKKRMILQKAFKWTEVDSRMIWFMDGDSLRMVLRIRITLRIRIDLKIWMNWKLGLDEGWLLNWQGFILHSMIGIMDGDFLRIRIELDGFAVKIGWGIAFELTGLNSMMRMDLRIRTGWWI